MQWDRAEVAAECLVCGLVIQPGERVFRPPEGEPSGFGCTHLSCAKASLPSSPVAAAPESPVCKHWRSRGFCLFGERCVFRHPPECLGGLTQQRASGTAPTGSAGAVKRPGNQAGKRRAQPRNKFRAGAFRRWLLDTFGREKLGEGAGVLDVAGGKGELAFELLNLNGLPATVLEPRPLDLQRRVKWLLNGFYHWNPHHARYNDRVWISSALEQQAQQQMEQQQGEQQPDTEAGQPAAAQSPADVSGAHMPDHLRLVISPALAACLVGRAADGSGADQPPTVPPPEWPAVFEQARQEAHHGRWLKPAPPHEQVAAAASGNRRTEDGAEDGTQTPVEASVEPAAPRTPEPAVPRLAAVAAPQRRRAVAWSIPADSESEQEEAWWCRAAGISNLGGSSSSGGNGGAVAEPSSPPVVRQQQQQPQQQSGRQGRDLPQQQQQQQKQKQPVEQQQPEQAQREPREVDDAGEAWRRLTQCSVVVGMHPDQATEFIVDLAIAHGKPFAIVPCCVFPGDFPRRTLCGQPVTSYDQFCEYLIAKDPQHIRTATLPFEGRNRVLYRLAP